MSNNARKTNVWPWCLAATVVIAAVFVAAWVCSLNLRRSYEKPGSDVSEQGNASLGSATGPPRAVGTAEDSAVIKEPRSTAESTTVVERDVFGLPLQAQKADAEVVESEAILPSPPSQAQKADAEDSAVIKEPRSTAESTHRFERDVFGRPIPAQKPDGEVVESEAILPSRPSQAQKADARKLGPWDGFRGIRWGTRTKSVSGLRLVGEDDEDVTYGRRDDKPTIGAATVEVLYFFYKGRFFSVMIECDGLRDHQALKAAIIARYGKPYQPNEYIETYHWGIRFPPYIDTKGVEAILSYNEFSEKTTLVLVYGPIRDQQSKDERKAAEKGAAEDF